VSCVNRSSSSKALLMAPLVFLLTLVAGDKSLAMTLEEALPEAIINSPKIQSARAKLNITRENLRQIFSNYLPTVLIDMSRGRERDDAKTTETGSREAEITNAKTAKISMSVNLYRGGKTEIETEEANNKIRADEASLKGQIQSFILEAATAYSVHYKNIKTRELNINNKAVLKVHLEAAKARSKYGEISDTNVFQAKARFADAVAKEIKSKGDFLISKVNFESIFATDAMGLLPASPLKIEFTKLDELLNLVTSNNFKLINLRELLKAARNNARNLKRDLLPVVDFDADYTRGWQVSNQYSDSRSAKFVVSLSMPLYRGGSTYSKIRQASISAAKLVSDYDQALLDVKKELMQAWFNYKSFQSQIIALKEAALSSKIVLARIKKEVDVGSRAFIEVLDAEQELLESNASILRATNELLAATYKIKEITGQLILYGSR
jgi:outer membrane protein